MILSLNHSSGLTTPPSRVQPTWKQEYFGIITSLFKLHLNSMFYFRFGSDIFWICGSLFFSLNTSVRILPKITASPVQTNAQVFLFISGIPLSSSWLLALVGLGPQALQKCSLLMESLRHIYEEHPSWKYFKFFSALGLDSNRWYEKMWYP